MPPSVQLLPSCNLLGVLSSSRATHNSSIEPVCRLTRYATRPVETTQRPLTYRDATHDAASQISCMVHVSNTTTRSDCLELRWAVDTGTHHHQTGAKYSISTWCTVRKSNASHEGKNFFCCLSCDWVTPGTLSCSDVWFVVGVLNPACNQKKTKGPSHGAELQRINQCERRQKGHRILMHSIVPASRFSAAVEGRPVCLWSVFQSDELIMTGNLLRMHVVSRPVATPVERLAENRPSKRQNQCACSIS